MAYVHNRDLSRQHNGEPLAVVGGASATTGFGYAHAGEPFAAILAQGAATLTTITAPLATVTLSGPVPTLDTLVATITAPLATVTLSAPAPAASVFTPAAGLPTNYRRLAYWFKASSLGLADGAAVTQLTDYSGNGRHITQATGGNQATKQTVSGVPVVRFDGVDDFYSLANFDLTKRSRLTVYAVFRMAADTVPSASHTLIEHTANAATTTAGWGLSVDIYNRIVGTIKNSVSGTCLKRSRHRVGTDFVICSTFFDIYQPREQAWVYVNGREEWSRTPSNSSTPVHGYTGTWGGTLVNDTLYVGMRGGISLPFAGDLAELIIFEEQQQPSERFAVEGYLAGDYAITDRLEAADMAGIVLFDGVSFTEGAPAAPLESWPNYLMRNAKEPWIWHNIANQGRTVRQQLEDREIEHDAYNDDAFVKRITTNDPGSNDIHYLIVTGDAAASRVMAYGWHREWVEQAVADGWDVVAHTMMDRGDFGTGTPADFFDHATIYNADMRTEAVSVWGATVLADVGVGSAETRFANSLDTIYFNADAIHQSDVGYRVEAEIIAPAFETAGMDFLPFGAMGTTEISTPLKFWFDAGQCRTFPNGANAPQHLEDKGLYLLNTPRSLNHGTAASRPTVVRNALNGHPAWRFNGTTQSLQSSGAYDLSHPSSLMILMVVNAITAGDAGIILELGTNSDAATTAFKLEHLATDKIKLTIVGDVGTSSFETTASVTGPTLITAILDKGSATTEATVLLNGAAEAGARVNANNTNGFASALGLTVASRNTASNFLAMDLCEMVCFGPVLSTPDRQEWEQWLCTKYGLAWSG